MPPKQSRSYRSEVRRRQAAETHSRIVTAAAEVFAAEGFSGATIAQIAERADVAVATVQKQGSKPALLRAAVELASFGVEGARDVFETDIGRAFLAIESADGVPAFAAEAFTAINGPMAELWRALAMGASSDPELSAFHADIVADIRRQDASVLGVLRDRGWLRTDVEPEDLLEAFCVITSIETYIRFVLSDRMPVTSYKRFVARLVRESILATRVADSSDGGWDRLTHMTRLEPGDKAPDFSLTDDTGKTVSLADLKGRKAIVYFYPAAMTPGCTTQACDFSERLDSLTKEGYAVVGVSPDKPEKLAKFRDKEHLTIQLLSDPGKEVLREWGAYGEKKLYGKTVEGVIRSTVVLDEQGTVTHAWYNVKATGHVAKLRRDLGLGD